ncbi:MAG: AMIN domain-containing protein, partial [Deltaproteobacteria bacterium]
MAEDAVGSGDAAAADPAPAGDAPEPQAAAPAAPDAPWVAVESVDVEPAGAGRRVKIALTRAPDGLREFLLGKPPRLVIDLEGPHAPDAQRERRFPVADGVVSRARVAAYQGRLRVVLDLGRNPRQHTVHADGATLIAELGDTSTAEAPEPMPAVEHAAYVAPVADRVPPPAAEPTPPPVAEAAPPPPPEPAPRRVAEVVPPPPADVPVADPPVEAEPAPPLPRHAAAPKAKEPRRSAVPAGGPGSFNGER